MLAIPMCKFQNLILFWLSGYISIQENVFCYIEFKPIVITLIIYPLYSVGANRRHERLHFYTDKNV